MGISLLPSAGFGPAVRWDLKVNKFLWRLQPSKFFLPLFQLHHSRWLAVKWVTHRLRESNTRQKQCLLQNSLKNVFPISLAL